MVSACRTGHDHRTQVREAMSVAPRSLLIADVAAASAVGGLVAVILIALTRAVDDSRLVSGSVLAATALCTLGAVLLTSHDETAIEPIAEDLRPDTTTQAGDMADQSTNTALPAWSPTRQDSRQQDPRQWHVVPQSPLPTATRAAPSAVPWHEAVAHDMPGPVSPAARQDRDQPQWDATHPTVRGPQHTPSQESARPVSSVPTTTDIVLGEPAAGGPVVRQVVQCPHCADFDLAVRPLRHEFELRCQACGHRWHWRPGDSWPVTVIRPSLGIDGSRAAHPNAAHQGTRRT